LKVSKLKSRLSLARSTGGVCGSVAILKFGAHHHRACAAPPVYFLTSLDFCGDDRCCAAKHFAPLYGNAFVVIVTGHHSISLVIVPFAVFCFLPIAALHAKDIRIAYYCFLGADEKTKSQQKRRTTPGFLTLFIFGVFIIAIFYFTIDQSHTSARSVSV
jgi:hypothetical protein